MYCHYWGVQGKPGTLRIESNICLWYTILYHDYVYIECCELLVCGHNPLLFCQILKLRVRDQTCSTDPRSHWRAVRIGSSSSSPGKVHLLQFQKQGLKACSVNPSGNSSHTMLVIQCWTWIMPDIQKSLKSIVVGLQQLLQAVRVPQTATIPHIIFKSKRIGETDHTVPCLWDSR